jgi:MFS family permease
LAWSRSTGFRDRGTAYLQLDRSFRRGNNVRRARITGLCLGVDLGYRISRLPEGLQATICFIPVVLTHSLPVAIVFLSLGLGFGLAPNAAFYALNADIAGDRAGTSLGIMASCTAGAAILAPWLTDVLKDATGNFSSGIALMIFFSLTAVVTVLLFQHPDRHARVFNDLR